MFDAFDSVRVISLPERTDRRRAMQRELRKVGGHATFFDAIKPDTCGPFRSRGSFGAFLSHAAVVEEAARKNESVLILQDDCNFLPEAKGYRVPDCDIFYGSHAEDSEEVIGAHCMGFSKRAVKALNAYLSDYLSPDFVPDAEAASDPGFNPAIRPPIDGACVWFRRAHPELTTHFALLTYQRSSRSDITPSSLLDRIPLVRDLAEIARRVLDSGAPGPRRS